jgi:phospholipid-binding lipoprotein MlaA
MSPLNTPWRLHPKVQSGFRLHGVAMTFVAGALAMSALSGAAMADPPAEASDRAVVNFIGSHHASEDVKRPHSSLLAKFWQVSASETATEAATSTIRLAATPKSSSRGLSHDLGDPDVQVSLVADVYDPLEPVNRVIFGFNEILDFAIMRPVSHAYRFVVPQPLRVGVANALHNFASPVIFANDVLQGRPDQAKTTFVRFLVNSTAGFGGLVDAAEAGGLPRHSEDFGRTLAVWGAGPGPYLVLPVFGPSTTRDTIGIAVDTVLHPATWLMWDLSFVERSSPVMAYTVSGHEAVLDEAEALRSTSPDFYATVRDIYVQRRAAAMASGLDDFDLDALPSIPTE